MLPVKISIAEVTPTIALPFAEYLTTNGERILACVVVDVAALAALSREGLSIQIDGRADKHYAWVVGPTGTRIKRLHQWVWHFWRGVADPQRKGEVIHHVNHDKFDNTLANLRKEPRSRHAAHHNAGRQIFRPHKRDNLGDLWRPPARKPMDSRPEFVGMSREQYEAKTGLKSVPPKSASRSTKQQSKAVEARLTYDLGRLRQEVDHLDEGKRIPRRRSRRKWTEPSTRRLGLTSPRRGCNMAEAAFVRYAIKFGWPSLDREEVTEKIATAIDSTPLIVRSFWNRIAVDEAMQAWVSHRAILPRRR